MGIEERKKTIGERLKAKRAHRGLSLDEVHEATKIQKKFLKMLEADNFSMLPSGVAAKGFLKVYANYLGLSAEPLINELNGLDADNVSPRPMITQHLDSTGSMFASQSYFRYAIYLIVITAISLSVYFALSGYSQEEKTSEIEQGPLSKTTSIEPRVN